uniref:PDZ domain-containing protein n=1 Tax=Noctiluca scintillans TaxID=2966 RepID=A0A7S1ATH8_NOCSC
MGSQQCCQLDDPTPDVLIMSTIQVPHERSAAMNEPNRRPKMQKPVPDNKFAGIFMEFRLPDKTRKMMLLHKRPLGLKFSKEGPPTITDVQLNSHANDLGIQVGWVITSVDHESMEGKDSLAVVQILRSRTSLL